MVVGAVFDGVFAMILVEMNVNFVVINDSQKCQRRPRKGASVSFVQ